jgi:ribosome-associated translation inhibitor RaiA
MVSREESTGARMAIDRAADVLEEQLRRLKERRIDRKQRAGELPAGAGEDGGTDERTGEEFA